MIMGALVAAALTVGARAGGALTLVALVAAGGIAAAAAGRWAAAARDESVRERVDDAGHLEATLDKTLSWVGDGVIVADARSRVARINPVAEALTGWRASDAIGRALAEVIRIQSDETSDPAAPPVAWSLRAGVTAEVHEAVLVARNGRRTPVYSSAAPIRTTGGEPAGVIVVLRDCTAQRRAEAAEATLLATIDDAVLGLDAAGVITFWAGAAERVYGWKAAEVIGRSVEQVLQPERAEGGGAAEFASLHEEESVCRRVWHRRKDGTRVPVEAASRVLRDTAGRLAGYVTANRDITAQVQAEEAARLSEQKFRTAFHQAGVGVLLCDVTGRILDHNRAMREMLGFTSEEVQALRIQDLGVPEDAARHGAALREVIDGTRAGYAEEQRWRRRAGPPLEILLRVSPIPGPSGAPGMALAIVEEVGSRRRLERQLLMTERLASMGMLAAGLAHEINNPLAFMLANLQFALEQLEREGGQSDLVQALADALEGATRVRGIMRDVKTFSREQASDDGACRIAEVVQSAANLARNEIRHRARLVLDIADVPPVVGSAQRIGQVFLNLLVNAAQAMPQGKAQENEIRVVALVDRPGWVTVEVRDTGLGIPREIEERLFQPFATSKTDGQGTGLGLFITHSIITSLGGTIEVRSTPGEGSCFRIELRATTEAQQRSELPSTAPARRAARVLVVDDEALVGDALRRILSGEHEIVVETRAAAALDRLAADGRFDVIFLDLMMPELTGMEFHRRLCERFPALARRTVLMTGGAFTPDALTFLQSVQNIRIDKPFDPAHVRALVQRTAAA